MPEWQSTGRLGLVVAILAVGTLLLRAEEPVQARDVIGFAAVDQSARIHRIGESENCAAVVLLFLSPTSDACREALPSLTRLFGEYQPSRIEWFGVVSDPKLGWRALADFASENTLPFPVLLDASGDLAAALAPTHAPEAFVLNPAGELLYRGGLGTSATTSETINQSQAGIGTVADLEHALAAVAQGERPSVARTTASGEPIDVQARQEPTFSRHIAPIVFARCTNCHRPGEVAPFTLASYVDLAKRADWVAEVTGSGLMPPWKARDASFYFLGERRLREREREIFASWARAGAPQGDEAEAPPMPEFPSGWQLGTPDLVLEMAEPFHLPASGPDRNRFFVIPIDIAEDKQVVGVEFRPGNPRIVHHAIMYLDGSGGARKLDAEDPEPGYEGFLVGGFTPAGSLGAWAPGYTPRFLRNGIGIDLKKGVDLALQIHYHPSGKAESDRSQVGIYFAREPTKTRLEGLILSNFAVNIPPGESRHRMVHDFTTPVDLWIHEITPHMHLLGTEMKVTATLPDGSELPLVWSDWDFNWQDQYLYAEPIAIPKGTKFRMEAHFDNSSNNPNNPNQPPVLVRFGEGTSDEMCLCGMRTTTASNEDRQALIRSNQMTLGLQLLNPNTREMVIQFIAKGQRQDPEEVEKAILEQLRGGRLRTR